MSKIRVAGVIENSTVDGPGFRTVVFTQGCPHHCKGCHNPETWSCQGGTELEVSELASMIMNNRYCNAITFSGGEPMMQATELCEMLDIFESAGKSYHVMTFTGFTFEHIKETGSDSMKELFSRSDLVVDGPFVMAEKSLELFYRGSRNQRILEGKQSIMLGLPVLAEIGDQKQKCL